MNINESLLHALCFFAKRRQLPGLIVVRDLLGVKYPPLDFKLVKGINYDIKQGTPLKNVDLID